MYIYGSSNSIDEYDFSKFNYSFFSYKNFCKKEKNVWKIHLNNKKDLQMRSFHSSSVNKNN